MNSDITQAGTVGIVVLLILDRVFSFLKSKKNGNDVSWIKNNPVDFHLMDKRIVGIRDVCEDTRTTLDRQTSILESQTKILKDIKRGCEK